VSAEVDKVEGDETRREFNVSGDEVCILAEHGEIITVSDSLVPVILVKLIFNVISVYLIDPTVAFRNVAS
jgi:hypothetical protein